MSDTVHADRICPMFGYCQRYLFLSGHLRDLNYEVPIEAEKDLKARILTLRETIENRPRILKCGPEQVTSLLRTDMNLLQIM